MQETLCNWYAYQGLETKKAALYGSSDSETVGTYLAQGRFKPLIFVEYRSPKQKKPRLLQFLRKLHYECVLLRMPIFNEQNFRRHQEDIWSLDHKLRQLIN